MRCPKRAGGTQRGVKELGGHPKGTGGHSKGPERYPKRHGGTCGAPRGAHRHMGGTQREHPEGGAASKGFEAQGDGF